MLKFFISNTEFIITIALAALVISLDIFGIVDPSAMTEVTLAVLTILAFSLTRNRAISKELNLSIAQLNKKIEGILERKSLVDYGIIGYFKAKPDEVLSERYKKAIKSIRILHTWLESSNPLPDAIFEAAQRGVQVTIILLDPKSQITKIRTQELGFDYQSKRPSILLEGVRVAISKQKDAKKNIKLYIHNCIPPFSIFAVDDWIAMGFYWNSRGSVASPHLELETKTEGFTKYLDETFENILNKAILIE